MRIEVAIILPPLPSPAFPYRPRCAPQCPTDVVQLGRYDVIYKRFSRLISVHDGLLSSDFRAGLLPEALGLEKALEKRLYQSRKSRRIIHILEWNISIGVSP